MNIALEKSQEFVSGQLTRSYGDAFIRGNNGKSHLFFYNFNTAQQKRWLTQLPYGIRSSIHRRKLM